MKRNSSKKAKAVRKTVTVQVQKNDKNRKVFCTGLQAGVGLGTM